MTSIIANNHELDDILTTVLKSNDMSFTIDVVSEEPLVKIFRIYNNLNDRIVDVVSKSLIVIKLRNPHYYRVTLKE